MTVPPTVKDSGPAEPVDVSHIPDAVPRIEPRTAAGNKSPYTVLGKTYEVMPDALNFVQRGKASWYGKKFHGLRTSNGEIYNMYGMTAAHKSLPIPTYVEVTNLENGRKVIVRVNDRGPFHGDRIIDLTYAAAKKLGFDGQGTADVEVRAIDPAAFNQDQSGDTTRLATTTDNAAGLKAAPAPRESAGFDLPANTYLQAGAFGNQRAAEGLRDQLATMTELPVLIEPVKSGRQQLFRVQVGPIADNYELVNLRELLVKESLGNPHVVYK